MHNKINIHFRSKIKLINFIICSLLITFCTLNIYGQSITPNILNASGGTATIATNVYDWSIGEMTMVSTFSSSSIIVTQGVLQPDTLHPIKVNNLSNSNHFNVFPNPSNEFITIESNLTSEGNLYISLVDMTGKVIFNIVEAVKQNIISKRINVSEMPNGSYILKVRIETNSQIIESTTFQIQKLK